MRILGSAELPVRSLNPTTVTTKQGSAKVYFLDYDRLTDVQRGGLKLHFQQFTGRAEAWSEYLKSGMPVLAEDCTPVQ